VITGTTTLLVLWPDVLGGEVIRTAVTLFFRIIVGTYSSVFIAHRSWSSGTTDDR
jgi:preprotein translocase subunit SecF